MRTGNKQSNKEISNSLKKAKPFLRWAGGKSWLKEKINDLLPEEGFKNYHEPFVGGGAIFFHLNPQKKTYLSDANPHLIHAYQSIKDDYASVIQELRRFKNTEEQYYKIRKANYRSDYKKTAQFIYLNQTSFNGLYRVNLQGVYNVPYGHRNNLSIDYDNFERVSKALSNTVIKCQDFSKSIKNVQKGDLVFLDPPYTVSHNKNGFIKYNQKIFSLDDQYTLSNCIQSIRANGAYYILTNAAHRKITEIFGKEEKLPKVSRFSGMSGTVNKRGKRNEYIFTNTI